MTHPRLAFARSRRKWASSATQYPAHHPDRTLSITNSTSGSDLFSANNLIQGPFTALLSAAALLGLARRRRA
jgi:hypothetical protein